MSSSTGTVYLISGANRGIGFAFVEQILELHDNAFVYAGARDPAKASALKELQTKNPGRISIVKCISADLENNAALAKEIEAGHGRVDTVIANAGISNNYKSIAETSLTELQDHFHVNVFGVITLFQSVYHLLKKSSNPKFVPVSSAGGCLDGHLVKTPAGYVAYGASKAALNWATRKIHFENEWLVAFPLSPGMVETDMLNDSAKNDISGLIDEFRKKGFGNSAATVAAASIKLIDQSTREKEGGEFMHFDGTKVPW